MLDVLVVGGGPSGFVTALGLAQSGVRVQLIEAEPRIIDSPRAAVYHWSVLDGLERLGIREEAEAIGFPKQEYGYLIRRTGERIAFDIKVLEGRTAFPYNIHLGQDRLADIARRRLEGFGNASIRFDARLVALSQDADGVTAQVEGKAGREEMRARWLIGADGAGSTVRRLAGLGFDGITWPERFVATNVHLDFEALGYPLTTLVVDDRHGAVIVKIARDGLWRWTYMEDGSLPQDSFMNRLPGAYSANIPPGTDYRVDRATPYRMHQRTADRYRIGRILLVGDAAHVTNPTGGYGLTSGLFDSYALHPALAAVILEGADDEVLDRYSEVRRTIFLTRTSPQATRNKRLVFHANGGGTELDEAVAMLRRVAGDPDFRLQWLGFTKSLESPPLLETGAAASA